MFKKRVVQVFIESDEELVTKDTLLPQINEGLAIEALFGAAEAERILEQMDEEQAIMYSDGSESSPSSLDEGSRLTRGVAQPCTRSERVIQDSSSRDLASRNNPAKQPHHLGIEALFQSRAKPRPSLFLWTRSFFRVPRPREQLTPDLIQGSGS